MSSVRDQIIQQLSLVPAMGLSEANVADIVLEVIREGAQERLTQAWTEALQSGSSHPGDERVIDAILGGAKA